MDTTKLYLDMKTRIYDAVTPENADTMIPACPKWTLRDILGHLAGSIEDFANGNTDGFGTPPWTQAQVDRYRDLDLEAMKTRWDEIIAEMGDALPEVASEDIPDIATHQYDVFGAIGSTERRQSPELDASLAFFADIATRTFDETGTPALRLIADGTETVLGTGEPEGELRTSVFEATRFMTGRRSLAQIRALDWSMDPAPWLEHVSVMPPRDSDLVE